MNFTVLLFCVNEPFVPLKKLPPTLRVPAPENVSREEVPADVILPETVAVPVDILRSV